MFIVGLKPPMYIEAYLVLLNNAVTTIFVTYVVLLVHQ